ncbi:MAG: helix-turn-helix domain-containing protein [Pararobbsia sp.]
MNASSARAAAQFREKGIDGISVADLMKAAGLTHGGFYRHFDSRDDLVTQAVACALRTGGDAFRMRTRRKRRAESRRVYRKRI